MADPSASLRSSCPVAASLDLFGDRWTLLVLRDMLFVGRSRFAELGKDEGIATNILSERLQRLMDTGLIVRTRDPDDGRRWVYAPTHKAVDLVPALVELMLWGTRHTAGCAPDWVLRGAQADKAGLIQQMTAMARERAAT